MNRNGVALLVTLWVVVAVVTLTAGALVAARDVGATASWRITRVRGGWQSRGCLAQARRVLDRDLEGADSDAWMSPQRLWLPPSCQVTFVSPTDGPTDMNHADAGRLETLPGFDPELARAVVDRREFAGPYADLDDLLERLGSWGADRLAPVYAALRARTTFDPWAWDVTAEGPSPGVRVAQRWIWGGTGLVVVVREWTP